MCWCCHQQQEQGAINDIVGVVTNNGAESSWLYGFFTDLATPYQQGHIYRYFWEDHATPLMQVPPTGQGTPTATEFLINPH